MLGDMSTMESTAKTRMRADSLPTERIKETYEHKPGGVSRVNRFIAGRLSISVSCGRSRALLHACHRFVCQSGVSTRDLLAVSQQSYSQIQQDLFGRLRKIRVGSKYPHIRFQATSYHISEYRDSSVSSCYVGWPLVLVLQLEQKIPTVTQIRVEK